MAKLIQQFNARNFDPEQGVGGFPIGNHLVKAISSEVKATKAGDGGFLMYTAQIIDGEHAGTTGAIRFNLYSSSPDAARIAHGQFSAMCHVCNVLDVQDSGQLHEIPFRIEVGLQKEPNPQKYTEVKKFYDVNGQAPSKNGPQGGGQQQSNSGFGGQQNGGTQQGNGGFGGGQQQQPDNNGGNNGGMGNQGGANAGNGSQWGNGAQGGNGGNMGNGQGGDGGGNAGNGGQWAGQQNGGNGGNTWGNPAANGAGNNGGNQWGSRQ